MACFLQLKDKIFIIPCEKVENVILAVGNAIVEKRSKFIVLKNITPGEKLSNDRHFFIENGKKVAKYCNLCKHRLREINESCKPCSFQPATTPFSKMDIEGLVFSLRSNGYYEVDQKIFNQKLKG